MKAFNKLLLFALYFSPVMVVAQNNPQMQIVQLNMPLLPGDTAFEANIYPLYFSVQNVSPVPVTSDTLYILAYNTDTLVAQQEHVLADTLISNLSQGMIAQMFNPFFQFSALNYKAGGNIVVVWPRLGNDPLTTFDSITVNIYFVPFQASLAPEGINSVQGIILNPDMHTVQFKTNGGYMPERVRIFDVSGRICFRSVQVSGAVYLPQISKGVYFIEWKNPDGSYSRLKFFWP